MECRGFAIWNILFSDECESEFGNQKMFVVEMRINVKAEAKNF